MALIGVSTLVLAKHSKSFSLIDCISVGVDRMQRNFEPMRKQVEAWQRNELTDVTAKVVIYEAFVEGRLEAPKHLSPASCMICTSNRSTRSSGRGRSGVFPTRLRPHSKNWIRFRSSRRRRSWESSWKAGFPSRSNCGAVPAGSLVPNLAVRVRLARPMRARLDGVGRSAEASSCFHGSRNHHRPARRRRVCPSRCWAIGSL